jgi:hypothetical protein
MRIVILSEASRSSIARGAVEGPAVGERKGAGARRGMYPKLPPLPQKIKFKTLSPFSRLEKRKNLSTLAKHFSTFYPQKAP